MKNIIVLSVFFGLTFLVVTNVIIAADITVSSNSVNTKVGNPTSQPPGGNFVFYCQWDPQWRSTCVIDKPRCTEAIWGGTTCTYKDTACGPTSMAMIMSSLGVPTKPTETGAAFVQNNAFTCEVGSNLSVVMQSSWFSDKGFMIGPGLIKPDGLDLSKAKEFLDNNYLIIGSLSRYIGGKFDHIVVIDKVDLTAGSFRFRDPNNCQQNGEEGSEVLKTNNSGLNWKFAIPIRKK
jgi:hypothetical protein